MILPLGAFSILHDLPRSRLSYINVGQALIVKSLNLYRSHEAPLSETRIFTWRQPTSTHSVCKDKGASPCGPGASPRSRLGKVLEADRGSVCETFTTFDFLQPESRSTTRLDGLSTARTWRSTR